MKRIIEHGFMSYMETTCPYCGCKFSFEWEDVISPTWDTYPTWRYDNTYITVSNGCVTTGTVQHYEIFCPECKRKFPILNWSFAYPRGNCPFTCGEWKTTTCTECSSDCTCHKCSDKND